MTISRVPPWNIAVITIPDRSAYSSLRNALLYGDHVHWVSMDFFFGIPALAEEVANEIRGTGRIPTFTIDEFFARSLKTIPEYAAFHAEMVTSGSESIITHHLDFEYLRDLLSEAESFITPQGLEVTDELRARLGHSLSEQIQIGIRDSRVIAAGVIRGNVQVDNWNAYEAAHAIAVSVSRLLLPDVSTLPLEVIFELRERLSATLSPMRAELLRFTETLRDMIGENRDSATLIAEAENLVATKVEPVVREADQRAQALMDAKWRKLLTGAAKAFGFAGAAFVDAKMLAKAVQQTLETTALALGEPEDKTPSAKATSQFVLEARTYLEDRVA